MFKFSEITKFSNDSFIYSIVNTSNGKRYVGSTSNLYRRMREHRLMLRKGEHHCIHLQNAFDLYGESCFQIVLIEECDNENLIAFEQKWLDRYGRDVLYNSTLIAEQTQCFIKPVYAICSKTGTVVQFDSAKDAAEKMYNSIQNGRQCVRRAVYLLSRSRGHYWTYDESETLESIKEKRKREKKRRRSESFGEVNCFDNDGHLVRTFNYVSDAADWCGSTPAQVSMAVRSNEFRKAGGLFWSRSKTFSVPLAKRCKAVNQLKDGTLIRTWDSAKQASEQLENITHKGISESAIGRQKSHGGYQWEFAKT